MPKSGQQFINACFEVGLMWDCKVVLMAIAHLNTIDAMEAYPKSLEDYVKMDLDDLNVALLSLVESGHLTTDGGNVYKLRWDVLNGANPFPEGEY